MTLLTEEEIKEVSWGEPDDVSLITENLRAGLSAIARAQLARVIGEIDGLRQRYVGIAFSQELDCWMEAVKKEIDDTKTC